MSVPILITVIIALIGFGFGAYAANRRDSKRIKGMNNEFLGVVATNNLLIGVVQITLNMGGLAKLILEGHKIQQGTPEHLEFLRKVMDDSGDIHRKATELLETIPTHLEDHDIARSIVHLQEAAKNILDRFSLLHAKAQQKA